MDVEFWQYRLLVAAIDKPAFRTGIKYWHKAVHPKCLATFEQPCNLMLAFQAGLLFAKLNVMVIGRCGYALDAEHLVRQEE